MYPSTPRYPDPEPQNWWQKPLTLSIERKKADTWFDLFIERKVTWLDKRRVWGTKVIRGPPSSAPASAVLIHRWKNVAKAKQSPGPDMENVPRNFVLVQTRKRLAKMLSWDQALTNFPPQALAWSKIIWSCTSKLWLPRTLRKLSYKNVQHVS